jgi:hypothetical protein
LRDGFPKQSLPKEKLFLFQNMTLTPSSPRRLDDDQTAKQPRKYRAFQIVQSPAFIWLNLEFGNIIQIQFPISNSIKTVLNHVIVQTSRFGPCQKKI